MPPEWGQSGARLPFSVEVEAMSTTAAVQETDRIGDGACSIEPCTADISITGFGGAAKIPVKGGGWQRENNELKFWLEFPEGSTRLAEFGCDTENVWGLAPGVAGQCDVELPPGRLFFETTLVGDAELEQRNKEYMAARAVTFRAEAAVATMEKAKNPPPVWNAARNAWIVDSKNVGFVEEQRTRAAVSSAAKAQREVDERRPKRSELSREAGLWPGTGERACWMGRKGTLWIKRQGPFGNLPFGVGRHYTIIGTWSAEPVEPVETFWTMPE